MTKSKKLSLKDLSSRPYTFDVVHPTQGKLDGVTITMHGPQSLAFLMHSTEVIKRNGAMDVDKLSAAEALAYTAEIYIPLIVSWDEDLFGPCTKSNVTEVLSNIEHKWIMEQIVEVFGNNQLFFGK